MLFAVSIFLACHLWTSVRGNSELYYTNSTEGRSVLLVNREEKNGEVSARCKVVSDSSEIDRLLGSPEEYRSHRVSLEEMPSLIEDCIEHTKLQEASSDYNNVIQGTPEADTVSSPSFFIFPGTLWCGDGDKAKHDNDFGIHEDTDRCCQAHDWCNDTIEGGGKKYNLKNRSLFTALNCQCDTDFYDCLDRVNTVPSNIIGNIYFNLLRRRCFGKNYPLTKKCKKYLTRLRLTCTEYERDTTAPQVYEWVPAKRYKKKPFFGPLTVTLPF